MAFKPIEILINAEVPKLEYPDFKPSEKPAHWRDQGARPEGGLRREDVGGQVPPPPPQEPKVNRVEASSKLELPDQAKVDTSKFPGGIVPTKLPPKRMFGRMKSGR